jgi:hypothetical protein
MLEDPLKAWEAKNLIRAILQSSFPVMGKIRVVTAWRKQR